MSQQSWGVGIIFIIAIYDEDTEAQSEKPGLNSSPQALKAHALSRITPLPARPLTPFSHVLVIVPWPVCFSRTMRDLSRNQVIYCWAPPSTLRTVGA